MKEEKLNIETVTDNRKKKFWKVGFVFSIIALGFILVIARLFFIQVIDYEKYRKQARLQQQTKVQLRAERGNIYDRNGALLASTVNSISLAVDPTVLIDNDDKERLCLAVENIFGIPSDRLLAKINASKGSFVWLVRGILPNEALKIDSLNIKGLLKIEEPKRSYLFNSLASQVIGCTNIDNTGITGIEKSMDSVLKGIGGSVIMNRDAIGRLMPTIDLPKNPVVHGQSLELTIDIGLQKIAEYELAEGVRKSCASSGTIAAINPKTGEILALASYPSYNPNNISDQSADFMRCRAVNDLYEPGSTFKLITAAVALEENLIHPGDMVDGCNGLLDLNDYKIRDVHPIGKVSFAEAFAKSSNIVFSTVANKIPGHKFYKYIRDFGFGLTTGIELPGEAQGTIKKPDDFDQITKRFMGFGYGIAVTPLQVLDAYACVANAGKLMKPYIIKSVINSDGKVIFEGKPEKIRQVISEETVHTLTELLCRVVEKGTGSSARIEKVRVAGKTGTTQQIIEGTYSKSSYTASFAGFFPADNPKLAMIIVLEKPTGDYYGGTTAAPIFRNIAQRWLSASQDMLENNSKLSSGTTENENVTVPDITGLYFEDASRILKEYGLKMASQPPPKSIIVSQFPKAGINILRGGEINARIFSAKKDSISGKTYSINVVGMSLRSAVAVLHKSGIKVKIIGNGSVTSQKWEKNENNEQVCVLICN